MTLPNFFIAGGARCGSTSLDAYCRVHPQIFMSPIKEPNYFSYGWGKVPFIQNRGCNFTSFFATAIKDMPTYRALFRYAGDAKAIGEASINYILHPQACEGIRNVVPRAKLIFILRQPVDRAWLSFRRSRLRGTEPETDFLAAWRDDERRRACGYWNEIHRYKGLYGKHLRPWFEAFPRKQINVLLFDDLKSDAAALMCKVYGFLGVDPDFAPDVSLVHNRTGEIANPLLRIFWRRTARMRAFAAPHVPLAFRGRLFRLIARSRTKKRPTQKLSPQIRKTLTAEMREDILALQELIDRDLSGWLETP